MTRSYASTVVEQDISVQLFNYHRTGNFHDVMVRVNRHRIKRFYDAIVRVNRHRIRNVYDCDDASIIIG